MLFVLSRGVIPAVSVRGERPTSSFVHPGMWDILTGWLFNDGTQLRVLPVAFFSSTLRVKQRLRFYSVIFLINERGLTQRHTEAGNTSQEPYGRLDKTLLAA